MTIFGLVPVPKSQPRTGHTRAPVYTRNPGHTSRATVTTNCVVLTEGGPFHSSICEHSIATALKRPSAAAALRPDGRQTAWLARWFRAPRKSDFVKCLTRLQCAPTIRSTFASGGRRPGRVHEVRSKCDHPSSSRHPTVSLYLNPYRCAPRHVVCVAERRVLAITLPYLTGLCVPYRCAGRRRSQLPRLGDERMEARMQSQLPRLGDERFLRSGPAA